MNDQLFDNLLNQILWTYIDVNPTIIYSCPDHTFYWSPQGYFLQVYIVKDFKHAEILIIKHQLSAIIQQLTGLKTTKIKICFFNDDSINEIK